MKKMGFFGLLLALAFQWMALYAEIIEEGNSSSQKIDLSKNAGCCKCNRPPPQGMPGPPGPTGPTGATGIISLVSLDAWSGPTTVPIMQYVKFENIDIYPPGAPEIQPIVGLSHGFTLAPGTYEVIYGGTVDIPETGALILNVNGVTPLPQTITNIDTGIYGGLTGPFNYSFSNTSIVSLGVSSGLFLQNISSNNLVFGYNDHTAVFGATVPPAVYMTIKKID